MTPKSPVSIPAATHTCGLSSFRAGSAAPLLGAAQDIKTSKGNVYGYSLTNPNASVMFVKFFNAKAADVVLGTTVPTAVVQVGANAQVVVPPGVARLKHFDTAISVVATSVLADTGAQTAPGSGLLVEVEFA